MKSFNNRAFTLLEILIVLCILIVIAAMAIPTFSEVRSNNSKSAYTAWCKLERRTDLTFEEWKALKTAGLLPQQNRNDGRK